jgi:hypothetical protein
VVHYRGRCRDHAKRRNAETRSQNRGIYNSKRWQITRSRYLFENPLAVSPRTFTTRQTSRPVATRGRGTTSRRSRMRVMPGLPAANSWRDHGHSGQDASS